MEDTLFAGDLVVSEKLSYGPRMPDSPFYIPWVNLIYCLYKSENTKVDTVLWDYKRLNGFKEIARNEIVVFNSPHKDRTVMIKRSVGLPGDTLQIIEGDVYVNQHINSFPKTVKYNYKFYYNNFKEALSAIYSLRKTANDREPRLIERKKEEKYLKVCIEPDLIKRLKQKKCFDSIQRETYNVVDTACLAFP